MDFLLNNLSHIQMKNRRSYQNNKQMRIRQNWTWQQYRQAIILLHFQFVVFLILGSRHFW